MEPYPEYKDSEVDWIGGIPDSWILKRIKFASIKIGSGITPKGGADVYQEFGIPLLRSQNIHFDGLRLDNVAFISEEVFEKMQNSEVFPGDVLLNITGASIGRCYYANKNLGKANVNQHVCIIRPNNQIKTRFLYFILSSNIGQTQIFNKQVGANREGLNFEQLKNFVFPNSSLKEQTTIASYLDHKTAKIDTLIEKKKKTIDLLKEERTAVINEAVTKGLDLDVKMKNSGIEWLGEIPEHWEVVRLKHLTSIISKGTTPSTIGKTTDETGDIRFIKAENIKDNMVFENPSNFIDFETNDILQRSKLIENDLLFVIAGATIGKVAILMEKFIPANTNQAVCFIRLLPKKNPKFAWFWLQSSKIQELIWVDAVQAAQPNLSMENLGNFYFPYPPTQEQNGINVHIEKETTRIDTTVQKTEKQINLLQEYRTALISEVVTGKIDVRDWKEPEK